ncbi:MAG: protein translocase subunit SecF [Candidatus Melainabacteria bacterium]|nr:protein translocase subunit SecF [Candidatus Melainabacteria bacterium]
MTATTTATASAPKNNGLPSSLANRNGPVDIVKHRWAYLLITIALLLPGLYFLIQGAMEHPNYIPLRLGIDFVGGTIVEYGFEKPVHQDDIPAIRTIFERQGYAGAVVQVQQPAQRNLEGDSSSPLATNPHTSPVSAQPAPQADEVPSSTSTSPTSVTSNSTASASATPVSNPNKAPLRVASIVSIRTQPLNDTDVPAIEAELSQAFGRPTVLQKNSIGPTLASELLTNGLLALGLAYILIVGYLAVRFHWDYAVCAIVALLHDTLFVIGFFAMLGVLFHTEVDSMFITGILTVVGFSVHDTIVVFDRLRENSRLLHSKKLPFGTIANLSINQTLARSINTSVTALLPLTALYFFGGSTTRDFVLLMLIGILVGTFSSICIATLLLVWWRESQSQVVNSGQALRV